MKLTVILMSVATTTISWAGERSITVCFPPNPEVNYQVQALAKGYASRIYHSVGIKLHWKTGCTQAEWNGPGTASAPNLTTIGIGWARKAPPTMPSGARASARPFQQVGERVTLYCDRLTPLFEQRELAPAILGHILAHEIGHVLMGYNGHTTEGLMKAAWSNDEQTAMLHRVMQFTPENVAQLHRSLDRQPVLLARY